MDMTRISLLRGIVVFLVFLVFLPTLAKAETMVLIHGYFSDSIGWEESHVMQPLITDNWRYGGNYRAYAQAVLTPSTSGLRTQGKIFYTVDLPYDATIELQAMVLGTYLHHLYSQRKEPIILVGHSAGGVVARAYITMQNSKPVKALVTIATPHLGTPVAELSEVASKTPLNMMPRMLGIKNFKHSLAVFSDLREEAPEAGNYMYWLNHRAHPSIQYFSIVRNNKSLRKLDLIVPPFSQNMNNVSALRGRSAVISSTGTHTLKKQDGVTLKKILQTLQ